MGGAAVSVDVAADDPEADAEISGRSGGGADRLLRDDRAVRIVLFEDVLQVARPDAGAFVLDEDFRVMPPAAQGQRHGAPVRREADGVVEHALDRCLTEGFAPTDGENVLNLPAEGTIPALTNNGI